VDIWFGPGIGLLPAHLYIADITFGVSVQKAQLFEGFFFDCQVIMSVIDQFDFVVVLAFGDFFAAINHHMLRNKFLELLVVGI
jgi:hypothetical protein